MGVRIANTFLDYTPDGANSTAVVSGYPLSNLEDLDHPLRTTRLDQVTESYVVIDLGATKTNLTVHIEGVNFASVKYQEASAATGTWADLTSELTISQDTMQGGYRRIDDLTLSSLQYLRIVIPAQTPVDSAAYFEIGSFAICESITELTAETEQNYPFEKELLDTSITNTFVNGAEEKASLGSRTPMILIPNFSTAVNQSFSSSNISELTNLLRSNTSNYLIDFNLGNSWEAYICKRSGNFTGSLSSPNTGSMNFNIGVLKVNN